jgi:hypothetical protein
MLFQWTFSSQYGIRLVSRTMSLRAPVVRGPLQQASRRLIRCVAEPALDIRGINIEMPSRSSQKFFHRRAALALTT